MNANFVKVTKDKNFTIIDNGIFQDKKLSLKAKGLLVTMLSKSSTWNFSIKGLTTLSDDGETTIRNALSELERNGYLKRTRLIEKGVIRDWKYTIYEERQNEDFSKKHDSEEIVFDEPPCEEPLGEKPQVEKVAQVNTNILSTEELRTNKTNTNVFVNSDEFAPETTIEHIQETEVYPSRRKRLFDTDDTVKSKPKKKGNLFERCVDEAKNRYHDELLTVVLEYLNYRIKSKQHGFGFQAWVNLLNKLDALADFDQEKIKIVEQSLQMKWDTFAELRTWGKKTGCERFGETEDMRSGVPVGEVMDIQF